MTNDQRERWRLIKLGACVGVMLTLGATIAAGAHQSVYGWTMFVILAGVGTWAVVRAVLGRGIAE